MDPDWLRWVKRLQAIAQDGLTYATDEYDAGRYEQVREVAAEILATRSTGELEDARGLLELERGPATPKVDVRAAVFDGGRILLVKEPDDGGWSLPGGWADVGESPAEAAVREVFEESGYRVRPVRLISALDRDRHGHPPIPYHVYKLVFLCEILDETPARMGGRTGWSSSASTNCPGSRARVSSPPRSDDLRISPPAGAGTGL